MLEKLAKEPLAHTLQSLTALTWHQLLEAATIMAVQDIPS